MEKCSASFVGVKLLQLSSVAFTDCLEHAIGNFTVNCFPDVADKRAQENNPQVRKLWVLMRALVGIILNHKVDLNSRVVERDSQQTEEPNRN